MEMYTAYRQTGLSLEQVDKCDAVRHVRSLRLRIRMRCTAVSHLYHDLRQPARYTQAAVVVLTQDTGAP